MKFTFLIVICIFSVQVSIAQYNITIPHEIFLQSINIDTYNSIGFSDLTRSMPAEIGSGNPAALANFSNMSAGVMFQYNTGIDYFSILDLHRAKQWLPSNFGFVVPYHDLRIGISYHQKYSSFLDYDKIEITTIQNPQGTGEFFSASSEIIIHSPSFLVSNSLNNIFTENDRLDVGGQIFIDFWEEVDKVSNTTATLSANDLSWKIGLSYAFNPQFKMAAVYEKGIDMEGELIQKDSDLFLIEPFDTTGFVQVSEIKIMQKINMPDKLSFGVTAQTSDQILLSSAFTFVYWNEINKQFKNQIDFSANAIYSISKILDFTMGVYVTDREVKDRELFDFSLPQNAAYFNFGVKTKMENFILLAELLDSHLISADHREYTIFKAGLNYQFDTNNL